MLGLFKIGLVFMALTDAGLTIAGTVGGQANLPPVIISTPNPLFTEGVSATYNMSQDFTDDGQSTVITSLINILPNGLSYNGNTHILTYDGIGPPSVSQHQLQVDDQVNPVVTSNVFNIDILSLSESDTPDYIDPVAGVTLLGGRTTVNATPASFAADLAAAGAGTTINLGAGTYGGAVTIDKGFPSNNPLIIKGAANFASILTGIWTTTGNFNIINGVKFNGTGAEIRLRGTNNKALACGFTGTEQTAVQLSVEGSPGEANEIAYCEFSFPNIVTANQFRQAIKMNTAGSGQPQTAQDDVWIHHNYFHDWDTTGYNQGDLIELGESGTYDWVKTRRIGCYIEDNLIERFERGGNECMDLKIGGLVVRRNTNRLGTNTKITQRQGEGSIFESNYLNPGTISAFSRDQIIVGNEVQGGNIRVNAGEIGPDEFTNLHNAAFDTLATGNIGTLSVGHVTNANYDVAADGTIIEDHTGTINFDLDTNTTDNRNGPSSRNFVPAVELQIADVGPAALANASVAYLAARVP